MDLSFEKPIKKAPEGDLKELAQTAAEERTSTFEYKYLDQRFSNDYEDSEKLAIVENYGIDSESHTFIYMLIRGNTFKLATNILPEKDDNRWWSTEPGNIHEYSLPISNEVNQFFDFLESNPAQSGIGGDTEVYDGDTHLFTFKGKQGNNQFILYGFSFEIFEEEPDLPQTEPDRTRHSSFDRGYNLWLNLLSSQPNPDKIIPRPSP